MTHAQKGDVVDPSGVGVNSRAHISHRRKSYGITQRRTSGAPRLSARPYTCILRCVYLSAIDIGLDAAIPKIGIIVGDPVAIYEVDGNIWLSAISTGIDFGRGSGSRTDRLPSNRIRVKSCRC